MGVPPLESGQSDFCMPAIAVSMQLNLLILEDAPQPLHQDLVVAMLPASPSDSDLLGLQSGHEDTRGELTALIEVEDLWPGIRYQRYLQGIETELRVQAI